MSAQEYAGEIDHLLRRHPWEIQLTQFNFLSSHDTARVLTVAGDDEATVELAALLLLTFPGAPCIFYGDEVGLPGGPDPDCRGAFPPEGKWRRGILDSHRRLIGLRRASKALRTGLYQNLFARGAAYVFARVDGDEEIIVALNVGDEPAEVEVKQRESQASAEFNYELRSRPDTTLYGGGRAAWHEAPGSHLLRLSLPPRGCIVLGASR
jgi:glycosidase